MKIHRRINKEPATSPCPEPAESRPNPLPNGLMSSLVVVTDGKNTMNDGKIIQMNQLEATMIY